MNIVYDTKKDLPCVGLRKLFLSVGWSDGTETELMLRNFNLPFINSTIVISAWPAAALYSQYGIKRNFKYIGKCIEKFSL